MPRISTDNYDTVASWNGSQDLFVVEQPDGTKVATPAMVKQYVLGNSIDDIYSVMGQMGAKNLIPYPYYQTTQTVNGITVTDNGDGSITLNGTASATGVVFRYLSNDSNIEIPLERKKYKLTFGSNAGSSGFHLGDISLIKTDSTTQTINMQGDAEIDNSNGDYVGIFAMGVYIVKNRVIDNVTLYPMLRLEADTDNTYRPYAKTNKELTEVIGDLSQTGLTGDSVAEQLGDARGKITGKAEKNPSAFSDYTNSTLYVAAGGMTITDIKGGYKKKDGICYVFMQVSFTGSFNTPGAWTFIEGFPASAVDGVPIAAVPTNNDANSVALKGGRVNTAGNLYIINESTLIGGNSNGFTFIGSYPLANP